ncbi:MAG: glycoside hydrolase family 13 protein [Acidimicrobiia bacterium]|nr:glycoside hydrolase family 13 protein [Acidimicrobiia bacterium]
MAAPDTHDEVPWWREAVVYQVYVRSFADADGDGIGDIPGIRSRLAHLHALGVDAVWLTPFYPSPQADGGYDVADYRDVDPLFGSLDDFDGLVTDAHGLGLRVVVDIVPNHTSSAHEWFVAALASAPGSRERARYLFRNGCGEGGDEPPNDWQSRFGGPAWTRVDDAAATPGQWYLHLFDDAQPDLDWTNDEVKAEFESVLRFWLDRGVDGFRIDVAHGLAKDPAMPDLGEAAGHRPVDTAGHPHWDRDEVHDVYRSWRSVIDEYPGAPAFVGEAWVPNPERLARYVRADELHTSFNFHFLEAKWDASSMRAAIDESLGALVDVGAPATWVLSNHDVTRHVTRYGGGDVGTRRARAAALLMLALPGSAYVFQGEELGLPEVTALPDHARQDPTFRRTNGADVGRDGCRVPIPWSGDAPSYGFGPGAASWLPQPDEWAALAVAAQERDEGSMLHLYRDAIALRRALPALGDGAMSWLDTEPGVLAFTRDPGFACVVNFNGAPAAIPTALSGGDVLVASTPFDGGLLPADTAVWLP